MEAIRNFNADALLDGLVSLVSAFWLAGHEAGALGPKSRRVRFLGHVETFFCIES